MDLTLADLILRMWIRRRLVACLVGACLAIALALALLMTPIYRAEVVVSLAADDTGMDGLSSVSGGLSGLASLAGMPLGGGKRSAESLGVLRSRTVLEKLISEEDLLPMLYSDRWNATGGEWKPGAIRPTLGDAIRLLQETIYEVREDVKSGLITVRFDWKDRQAAARWANELVRIANEELRQRTMNDAAASVEVLSREMKQAESIELRSAISRLMEAQLKTKTLAEVRRQYAFKVIDPAVVPDKNKRVRPARTLIVLSAAILGLVLSSLVVIAEEGLRSRREKVRR